MLLSPYQSNWYFRARFCTWNGQPCHKVASLSLFIIPLICGTCIKESPRPLPLNAGLTVLTYFLRFFPEPSTHSVVAYERVGCKVTCQATGPLIALFCFLCDLLSKYIPQYHSSELSPQSLTPSQTSHWKTQCLLLHWYSQLLQFVDGVQGIVETGGRVVSTKKD